MFYKTLIKNSSPSVFDVNSLQNLVIELDAPAEELVSGGTRLSPISVLGTLNPKTRLGDVTPIEEIGTVGSRPYEGCDPGTCC
ncbi:MAG: hypothetical protein AB1589_07915 [Cyanobacteriota bacterium]